MDAYIHFSATERNTSGDEIRDSLVDQTAAEVSDGIPDGCMGQVRDGLDSSSARGLDTLGVINY